MTQLQLLCWDECWKNNSRTVALSNMLCKSIIAFVPGCKDTDCLLIPENTKMAIKLDIHTCTPSVGCIRNLGI